MGRAALGWWDAAGRAPGSCEAAATSAEVEDMAPSAGKEKDGRAKSTEQNAAVQSKLMVPET